MKQTAVEWLVKELGLEGRNHTFYNTIEQAKVMEKEQIIEAFDIACEDPDRIGKEYYDQTYKKNE
jgi:hypothetical protein